MPDGSFAALVLSVDEQIDATRTGGECLDRDIEAR